MDKLLTQSNIMFVLGLLGTLFVVYSYFKKPQEITETKFAVGEERDKNKATILAQSEAEGKAALLALEVQREKEYNTKKFIELTDRFGETDRKIEVLISSVNDMNLSLSKELMRVATLVGQHLLIDEKVFKMK